MELHDTPIRDTFIYAAGALFSSEVNNALS